MEGRTEQQRVQNRSSDVTSPRAHDQSRRALRNLSDEALIGAMREGVAAAWQEFMTRFRPLLVRYGDRIGMDHADWNVCVDTVLEEAAMRWVDGGNRPKNMAGYLLRAATFHRRSMERDAKRRAKRYAAAAGGEEGEGAVLSLCSEASVRDSYGPAEIGQDCRRGALERFWSLLGESLTDEERSVLARLGDGLPHREIAAELGLSYETGRKRIQRLCARVRALVPQVLDRMNATEREQVEQFLKRLRPAQSRGADDVV